MKVRTSKKLSKELTDLDQELAPKVKEILINKGLTQEATLDIKELYNNVPRVVYQNTCIENPYMTVRFFYKGQKAYSTFRYVKHVRPQQGVQFL